MQLVALMAGKLSNGVAAIDRGSFTEHYGFLYPLSRSLLHIGSNSVGQKIELMKLNNEHLSSSKLISSSDGFFRFSGKPYACIFYKERAFSCSCNRTFSSEAKGHMRKSEVFVESSSDQLKDGDNGGTSQSLCKQQPIPGTVSTYVNGGLAQACKFAYNDAKFVNERARNDIFLLSRGITRLNNRARQDVAVLGLGFLKLDARAREDTEKIDHGVKNAAHIHNVATGNAQSKLKRVVDQHWSDGALEADIRRADLAARRRAIEDAFMALKFVKRIHDMMVNKLYEQPQKQGSFSVNDMLGFITLEKNGRAVDLFTQEVSTDRISAIQDAYWSMASALSDADGIDYTDPEELELLVATLIDLDAMDGKGSVSLLAECSSSPDVGTRQALANALSVAPSMWILGNAGMGALQRLAEDSNPAVAAAASKAIEELKQQWELEEGDSLRFMMNQFSNTEGEDGLDSEADNLTG